MPTSQLYCATTHGKDATWSSLHGKVLILGAFALVLAGLGQVDASMRKVGSGLGQPSGRLGHPTQCFHGSQVFELVFGCLVWKTLGVLGICQLHQ